VADGGATVDARPAGCPLRHLAPSGPNQPGDLCASNEDCAHAPDELAWCEARDQAEAQLEIQRCHQFTRAKLGEPCALTVLTNGEHVGAIARGQEPIPDVSGFCDLARGLVCDARDRRCRALPELGQSCAGHGFCARGVVCGGDVCQPAHLLGEPCQSIGDFVDQPPCVPSARCDIFANVCVPAVPEGGACTYGPQCASGVCINTACAPEGTCPP
jgi:hypothetical protein